MVDAPYAFVMAYLAASLVYGPTGSVVSVSSCGLRDWMGLVDLVGGEGSVAGTFEIRVRKKWKFGLMMI